MDAFTRLLALFALTAAVFSVQAAPLVQVVEFSGYRPRFDGAPNTLVARYLLIDPSNAVPADGFAPLEPVAVLMLFVGGSGKLGLVPGQQNVGTSRGTIGATGDLQTVTLESISVPVLLVTHKDDQCPVTNPKDSRDLKHRFASAPRVQVLMFNGASAPLSDACDPLAPHGFFGVEQKVIEAIAKWIKHAAR